MELLDKFTSISQIIDIFQMISIGRKSGKVVFSSKEGDVSLFFSNGMLIWLSSNCFLLKRPFDRFKKKELSLKDAVKVALHYVNCWDGGNVKFIEKEYDFPFLEKEEILNIVLDFLKEIDELPKAFKKMVSSDKVLIFSGEIKSEKIVLDRKDVGIIYDFLQGKKIREVIFTNPPLKETAEKIVRLISEGLLIPVKDLDSDIIPFLRSPSVSLSSQERLRDFLIELLGPAGLYIYDESLKEFGLPEIPFSSVEKFVDIVISKIPVEELSSKEFSEDSLRLKIKKILFQNER